MAISLSNRRLWWKEWRQLLPLLLLLVLLAVILHLAFLMSSRNIQQGGSLGILLGLPGLFAVGAGAMLVGQEKELRTLSWLSTMPVPPKQIVATKLAISTLALVALWPVSMLIALPFGAYDGFQGSDFSIATFPLHSLFVLLSGFALAWRLQSSLVALIALIPIAAAPSLLANVLTRVIEPGRSGPLIELQPNGTILAISQLILCGVALWWGWRNANLALGPARAPRLKRQATTDSLDSVVLGAPQSPWSALLWQMATQNMHLLRWIAAPCGAALALLAITQSVQLLGPGPAFSPEVYILPSILLSAVLGVAVFQGDQLHSRIRFLADRGVSPSRVWRSRHAILGSCVLGIGLLAAACFAFRSPTSEVWQALPIMAAMFLVYSVSQWASQVATSPIVAAVAGPTLSIAVAVYGTVCFETFGSPVILLLIASVLPFVATRLTTCLWMDRNLGLRFWAVHAITAMILLVMPALPMLYTWMTAPRMAPEIRTQFMAITTREPSYPTPPTELVVSTERPFRNEANDLKDPKEELTVVDRVNNARNNLVEQLQDTGPARGSSTVAVYLSAALRLTRLGLDAENVDVYSAEQYNELVEISIQVVKRLRQSPRIKDQGVADLIEIALLEELLVQPEQSRIDSATEVRLRQLLSDYDGRMAARKRSIALSWRAFTLNNSSQPDIGGYVTYQTSRTNARNILTYRGQVECMLVALWRLAASSPGSDTSSHREQLALFWNVEPPSYGVGRDAWLFDVHGPFATEDPQTVSSALPGLRWNLSWEQVARSLAPQP